MPRCNKCHRPMCEDRTKDHHYCSGACECGGLIENTPEEIEEIKKSKEFIAYYNEYIGNYAEDKAKGLLDWVVVES